MSMLRRLFRRGPNKPPVILGQLAQALEAMGLQATVLSGGEHEPAAPSIDPGLSERVVGRIAITGGPPDALQIGVLGPGQGHLSSGGATAYHALIRRGELAESWPDGRVEAKRQFRAGQIGPARDFHWTAADNSSASREAAQHLNGLNALRSDILHCLQQPRPSTTGAVHPRKCRHRCKNMAIWTYCSGLSVSMHNPCRTWSNRLRAMVGATQWNVGRQGPRSPVGLQLVQEPRALSPIH